MIYTTLARIRAHRPCAEGWEKLLRHLGAHQADDDPLPLAVVLESNDFDDALWCLRAEPQHPAICRMYAVRRAESVRHLLTDDRSLAALAVARRHALGVATDAERDAARDAAWDATRDAAWDATRVAAWAATTATARTPAWAAAWDAAWAATRATALIPAWAAAWDAAWAATRATNSSAVSLLAAARDFSAMLAAHEAAPEESCALSLQWANSPQPEAQ